MRAARVLQRCAETFNRFDVDKKGMLPAVLLADALRAVDCDPAYAIPFLRDAGMMDQVAVNFEQFIRIAAASARMLRTRGLVRLCKNPSAHAPTSVYNVCVSAH
ncbi:hypothetical protein EON66_03080 [archaeon]|nr:MAG: hypothetical protein EON66_03080 [archaeon]